VTAAKARAVTRAVAVPQRSCRVRLCNGRAAWRAATVLQRWCRVRSCNGLALVLLRRCCDGVPRAVPQRPCRDGRAAWSAVAVLPRAVVPRAVVRRSCQVRRCNGRAASGAVVWRAVPRRPGACGGLTRTAARWRGGVSPTAVDPCSGAVVVCVPWRSGAVRTVAGRWRGRHDVMRLPRGPESCCFKSGMHLHAHLPSRMPPLPWCQRAVRDDR